MPCVAGVRVIILHTHASYAWRILAEARQLNMFSSGWAWVVTDGVTLSDVAIPLEDAEEEDHTGATDDGPDQPTTDSVTDQASLPPIDSLVSNLSCSCL